MTQDPNEIMGAFRKYPDAHKDFHVGSRGRPERAPDEKARRSLRRMAFGRKLRDLREQADLTLVDASQLVGMSSSRKLAQYETTCFPPGEILVSLAPHYGIKVKKLCELLLSHSDPELYRGLTGKDGYEPEPEDIQDEIARLSDANNKD